MEISRVFYVLLIFQTVFIRYDITIFIWELFILVLNYLIDLLKLLFIKILIFIFLFKAWVYWRFWSNICHWLMICIRLLANIIILLRNLIRVLNALIILLNWIYRSVLALFLEKIIWMLLAVAQLCFLVHIIDYILIIYAYEIDCYWIIVKLLRLSFLVYELFLLILFVKFSYQNFLIMLLIFILRFLFLRIMCS